MRSRICDINCITIDNAAECIAKKESKTFEKDNHLAVLVLCDPGHTVDFLSKVCSFDISVT